MMNQDLLDRVLKSPRLPSLPVVALEVIELVQQRDVNIKQIASTIQHDPALSSKILKTVNSSFYGQSHSISTVSHALVVLGLNSVKTLALGFSLVGNLTDSGGEGFDHLTFWKRSIFAATAAKTLAKACNIVQQEEAFLGGLLQDLGMLAMNQTLGEAYATITRQAGPFHRRLRAFEQRHLSLDHAEVGAALGESWMLPPLLLDPVRYHEEPEAAPEATRDLVRLVALGGRAAEVFVTEGEDAAAMEEYYNHAANWFGISRENAEPLLKEIHDQTHEMRRLFDLPTGELGNPDEILSTANETLAQLTLQQTTALEQEKQKLIDEVYTDPLTAVANRRRFNEYVSAEYRNAVSTGSALSVLFLDTDHFKRFNDSYGHAVGDRVLIELGKTLTRCVEETGLVARYGGEEFAMVLPKMDRRAAAALAEQIRQEIEATSTVHSDEGEPLRVTASIGVATYEGTFFRDVEHLIKAADQGVYAAKRSGRNCVRIFTPREKSQVAA